MLQPGLAEQSMIIKFTMETLMKLILFFKQFCFFGLVFFLIMCFFNSFPVYAEDTENHLNQEQDYLSKGFQLMKTESVNFLKIGLLSQELTKKIGMPSKKTKMEENWVDGNLHQMWYYPQLGIELDMVLEENTLKISRLRIIKPCHYQTKKGIRIGSKRLEVIAAYKDYIEPHSLDEEEGIVAGSVYGGIIFTIEKGKVVSIFIGAASE